MELLVECPFCGYRFKTKSIKRVKCYNCDKTFRVYYKTKIGNKWVLQHRIVNLLSGTKEELIKRIEEMERSKEIKKQQKQQKSILKTWLNWDDNYIM